MRRAAFSISKLLVCAWPCGRSRYPPRLKTRLPHSFLSYGRCQVNERRAHFAASDGAAVDSVETRHRVPVGERSRAEQPVVSRPEQVAANPEEIVHDAMN